MWDTAPQEVSAHSGMEDTHGGLLPGEEDAWWAWVGLPGWTFQARKVGFIRQKQAWACTEHPLETRDQIPHPYSHHTHFIDKTTEAQG